MQSASTKSGSTDHIRADMLRESSLRERLKRELEYSPPWNRFRPENPFSGLTGLHSLEDYVLQFTLHLPEIYEETFRVESYAKSFSANRSAGTLTRLTVALQHLGRNHISFVLQPLQLGG